jgi:hypothetical protein
MNASEIPPMRVVSFPPPINLPRQIAQIATSPTGHGGTVVNALCDDGSLWELIVGSATATWNRLPDIPQPVEGE